MRDSAKPRLAIDLDEIEMQLSQASLQPPAAKNDPLAELARIVGQDDPFRSLLGSERGRTARAPADVDDIFVHGHAGHAGEYADPAPDYWEPSASYDPHSAGAPHGYVDASQTGYPDHQHYEYADQAYGEPQYEPYDDLGPIAPPRRSRKNLVAVAAVLGVAIVGVASALAIRGPMSQGGEPPLIVADQGAMKVEPQNPGGVEIPNQNKQIYARAGQNEETHVVNREEQPVDVRETSRQTSLAAIPDADLTDREGPVVAMPPVSAAVAALGEPRRVRTVSVRPDGTIISDEQPIATASTTTGSAPVRIAAAPAVPDMNSALRQDDVAAVPSAQPEQPAAVVSQTTPMPTPAPEAPVVPVREVASAQGEPAGASVPAPRQEVAAPRPVAPTQVAALPAPKPEIASKPPEATADAVPAGAHVIQLAIRGSEDRAREAFTQLRGKYAAILGDGSPVIRRAEVNGNTIYRVRIGPYSAEAANTACTRIKASGGECFVARN